MFKHPTLPSAGHDHGRASTAAPLAKRAACEKGEGRVHKAARNDLQNAAEAARRVVRGVSQRPHRERFSYLVVGARSAPPKTAMSPATPEPGRSPAAKDLTRLVIQPGKPGAPSSLCWKRTTISSNARARRQARTADIPSSALPGQVGTRTLTIRYVYRRPSRAGRRASAAFCSALAMRCAAARC